MEKYGKISPCIMTITHRMIENYYNTDVMPGVFSKDLITKPEDDRYTAEQIELLYVVVTER